MQSHYQHWKLFRLRRLPLCGMALFTGRAALRGYIMQKPMPTGGRRVPVRVQKLRLNVALLRHEREQSSVGG